MSAASMVAALRLPLSLSLSLLLPYPAPCKSERPSRCQRQSPFLTLQPAHVSSTQQGEVEQISMMKPKAEDKNDTGLLEYLEDIIGTDKYIEGIQSNAKQ